MQIDIKEINGDVHISGNVITINHGNIILADGTVICSGQSSAVPRAQVSSAPVEPFVAKTSEATHSEEFEVGVFDSITVRSTFNVEFSVGEKRQVIVEATKKSLEQVLVETRGNNLELDMRAGSLVDQSEIKVRIVSPRLSQAITYGNSTFCIVTPIRSENTLMLSTHNASQIYAKNIICPTVYLSAIEGSTLSVESVEARMAVIAKAVQAGKMSISTAAKTECLYVTTSEASHVNMTGIVSRMVVTKLSDNSHQTLAGSAQKVEFTTAGNSEIDAKELVCESGKAVSSEVSRVFANVVGHFDDRAIMKASIMNVNK